MKKYILIGNAQSVHVLKWVKELVKYFELYIISSTTTHKEIHSILSEKNIFDLNLSVNDDGGNSGLIKKYFKVKHLVKKIDPDFVNPHYITSHGFLAALIKKTTRLRFKLIQSAWGTDILVTPFKNKLYYHISKFCLNSAHMATSDSEFMTKVIHTISSVKTSTFIFGIDQLPDVDPEEKDKNLFYSNRMLSDNYNIDEVIRLFHKISAANNKALLVISHDGSKRVELEQLVRELELDSKATFTGFVSLEEQNSFYKKAQFYISIPTSDSTSVSLIEAMAFGCIPIVSDIPANHEWIAEEKNGLFYSPMTSSQDIEKLLSRKDQIFTENRKIIGERAIFSKSMKTYVETINTI